jgi:uncharacterized membrane protein
MPELHPPWSPVPAGQRYQTVPQSIPVPWLSSGIIIAVVGATLVCAGCLVALFGFFQQANNSSLTIQFGFEAFFGLAGFGVLMITVGWALHQGTMYYRGR